MNEFLVDFLPGDLRKSGMMLTARRRSMLLIALLCSMVVGAAAHSWNRYRQADAERAVSLQITTNSTKVDDVINKLAAEQQQLTRFLNAYERIALPFETSDLVATITNLLPERTSLGKLKVELEHEKVVRDEKPAAAKPAKGAKAAPAAAAKPAKHPARWLQLTIQGFAANTADLYEFERKLAGTAPFDSVTVAECKSTEVPGAKIQEFSITCRVPLGVKYEQHAPAAATPPVAEPETAATTEVPKAAESAPQKEPTK